MRIIEGQPPNCRGFALNMLDLIKEESFVAEGFLDEFPLAEVSKDKAVAIGILYRNQENLLVLSHLMVIDRQDTNYVWHRPGIGIDPVRDGLWTALNPYDEKVYKVDRIVYLGVNSVS